MITHLATSCLFPAVRLAQFIRPCMSDLCFLCELRIPVSSFPKFLCVSLDTHRPDVLRDATLFVDPGRPSESSPMRFLCFGFWAVEIIAICIWAIFIADAINGAVSSPVLSLSKGSENTVSLVAYAVPCLSCRLAPACLRPGSGQGSRHVPHQHGVHERWRTVQGKMLACTCPCHPARMVWCGTGENAAREAVPTACLACPVHLAGRSLRDPLHALLGCFYCCFAIFDANNTRG